MQETQKLEVCIHPDEDVTEISKPRQQAEREMNTHDENDMTQRIIHPVPESQLAFVPTTHDDTGDTITSDSAENEHKKKAEHLSALLIQRSEMTMPSQRMIIPELIEFCKEYVHEFGKDTVWDSVKNVFPDMVLELRANGFEDMMMNDIKEGSNPPEPIPQDEDNRKRKNSDFNDNGEVEDGDLSVWLKNEFAKDQQRFMKMKKKMATHVEEYEKEKAEMMKRIEHRLPSSSSSHFRLNKSKKTPPAYNNFQ